jgi:hypothetical protein
LAKSFSKCAISAAWFFRTSFRPAMSAITSPCKRVINSCVAQMLSASGRGAQ